MDLFDYDNRGIDEMIKKGVQSVEPNIADLANGWLKKYKLDYKLEQESLNSEIDKALNDYFSKNGGAGGNRPDCKLLLQDKDLNYYPILIEYKGYKDALIKTKNGMMDNTTDKNEPNYKNISNYAVNGAVHYAQALLHFTSYRNIIAIGMTGYKDEQGKLHHEIGVYYVSEDTFAYGIEVDKYDDLSFLSKANFEDFVKKIKDIRLSDEEKEKLKEQREKEVDTALEDLNNYMYNDEKGLSERERVYLVAATVMATLGIPGEVAPLDKSELKSSKEDRDGDIMVRKIKKFLQHKNLPDEKRKMIVRTLENTLTSENINRITNGETQLKRVFTKIVDTLGIYYKMNLTTDFTGKLFNEMYRWLGFTQDKQNDVVLTPFYVATLLVKLAKVNYKSYVWDFATGSAGLLVAAMNEMLIDAKDKIHSPEQLAKYEVEIKAEHLLGIEILQEVYMLAILNMIMMGDGSSNILNDDSLNSFEGKYGYGKKNEKFPADAFVLNPPYSADGNGMIFVERALGMMTHGYGAIIIQGSTGSGKATDYNKRILKHSTLVASIKMPRDLFVGKSSVQTYVYVFRVGEAHNKNCVVKFIDFSNDGYARSGRKKSKKKLVNKDHAKERYQEVVDLVLYGKEKLHFYSGKEYYEGHIDPENGADWNQAAPIDARPTEADFRYTVEEYLAWKLGTIVRKRGGTDCLGKFLPPNEGLGRVKWGEFRIGDLFEKLKVKKAKKVDVRNYQNEEFCIPVVYCKFGDNGIMYWGRKGKFTTYSNVISVIYNGEIATGRVYAQEYETGILAESYFIKYRNCDVSFKVNLFFSKVIERVLHNKYSRDNLATWSNKVENDYIMLPVNHGEIDFKFMEEMITKIEEETKAKVNKYFSNNGF